MPAASLRNGQMKKEAPQCKEQIGRGEGKQAAAGEAMGERRWSEV